MRRIVTRPTARTRVEVKAQDDEACGGPVTPLRGAIRGCLRLYQEHLEEPGGPGSPAACSGRSQVSAILTVDDSGGGAPRNRGRRHSARPLERTHGADPDRVAYRQHDAQSQSSVAWDGHVAAEVARWRRALAGEQFPVGSRIATIMPSSVS